MSNGPKSTFDLDNVFNEVTAINLANSFIDIKNKCFMNISFRDAYNKHQTIEHQIAYIKSTANLSLRAFKILLLESLDDILPKIIKATVEDIGMASYMSNHYHVNQETMKIAETYAQIISDLPKNQQDFFLIELKHTFNKEGFTQADAATAYNFGLKDTGNLANRAFHF